MTWNLLDMLLCTSYRVCWFIFWILIVCHIRYINESDVTLFSFELSLARSESKEAKACGHADSTRGISPRCASTERWPCRWGVWCLFQMITTSCLLLSELKKEMSVALWLWSLSRRVHAGHGAPSGASVATEPCNGWPLHSYVYCSAAVETRQAGRHDQVSN